MSAPKTVDSQGAFASSIFFGIIRIYERQVYVIKAHSLSYAERKVYTQSDKVNEELDV